VKPKIYLFISFIALSLDAHSFEEDKLSHFGGAAVISFASYSYLKETQYPLLYSAGIATAIGVGVEWHDKNTGHGFSKSDFGADIAGGFTGAYLGIGFYYRNKQLVYRKGF